MSDLLLSLHVPRDLIPGMESLFIWAALITLALLGLFIVRLYLRSSMKKQLRAREAMAMSMMDIDAMRKRGLVSDAEYKAIRHSLAEREVEKERPCVVCGGHGPVFQLADGEFKAVEALEPVEIPKAGK
jgi:uncharacterized protein YneF (UPF0154 family)